jgi:hypothetical protein
MHNLHHMPQSKSGNRPSAQLFTRRRIALSACCAATLLGATYISFQQREKGLLSAPGFSARIQIMQEHLATQTQPYIILAGDSHAELLGWDRVCGRPIINLGLSGVAAIHYGKIMSRLKVERPAESIVVFLGTNDLSHKLKPSSEKSSKRFENRFQAVINDAQRFASRVVYANVLPNANDSRAASWLDTSMIAQYRGVATRACLQNGCQLLDTENAAISATEDGVHIDRSDRSVGAKLYALVERKLCPGHHSKAAITPFHVMLAEEHLP